jgi:hypothetical protein
MQNSRCRTTIRGTARARPLALTHLLPAGYELAPLPLVAADQRPPAGLLHGISKTGLAHAKFRVFGIKRFANCVLSRRSESCATF